MAHGSGGRRRRRRTSSSGWSARPTTRVSLPRSIPTRTWMAAEVLRPGALLLALDQVQDPRNLGAICRSAEVAGAGGVVIPGAALGRGHRRRLQGLGGSGRASADRPGRQPRRLVGNGTGGRLLDLGRGPRGRPAALGGRPRRLDRARAGRGGEGCEAARRVELRRGPGATAAGAGRLAERLRGRRGAAVRGGAAAG